MDSLAGIRVFLAVVDTGSFTAAAERLGLSRAMVSKHMAALEQRLGIRLLNRTTRRLSLTAAGAAYRDRAAQALSDLDEAESALGVLGAAPRGTLRVNSALVFGVRHVAPALGGYLQQYPDVQLQVDYSDRIVDLVEEGYDLGLRIGQLATSALVARRLAPVRMITCASPAYLGQRGTPRSPAELAAHDCLDYSYSATAGAWRFRDGGGSPREITVRVRGPLLTNNGEALAAAALAGVGIVQLPSFIIGDHVAGGRLQPVLAQHEPEPLALHAVYPSRRHLSAKVRTFIDFLAGRFGPEPYWDCWASQSDAAGVTRPAAPSR
jgi:DNA-binding transcriptional LysR family regulator